MSECPKPVPKNGALASQRLIEAECLGPQGELLSGKIMQFRAVFSSPPNEGDLAVVQARYGYTKQVFGLMDATFVPIGEHFESRWHCLLGAPS